MRLPVMPPVSPMLAKATPTIPAGMFYEGKWDGFRAVVFKDGDEIEIGSRNTRPLTRYFPEVVERLQATLPDKCVLDGEIVIAANGSLDFEALLQRVHPAESRVRMLAETTPAWFVAFDLLAEGDNDLMEEPFALRRARLTELFADIDPESGVFLAPGTVNRQRAEQWFTEFEGAGLDGIVAKPVDLPYQPGKRSMLKIKHERTADCVVAGFRWHKSGGVVGSLLLGLYDDEGVLQMVGGSGAFTAARRIELVDELAPYRVDEADHGEHPWLSAPVETESHGGQRRPDRSAASRWNADKDKSFEPLRPELVVEVAYDHMQSGRFRHTAQFRRWRPDRTAESCTYEQLEIPPGMSIDDVLNADPT